MAQDQQPCSSDENLALLVGLKDEWFLDIAFYLTYGECPKHLIGKAKRTLKLKEDKFVIVDDILYKKGLDGMFLHCVDKGHQEKLLQVFHNEAHGGHYSSIVTTFKILCHLLCMLCHGYLI